MITTENKVMNSKPNEILVTLLCIVEKPPIKINKRINNGFLNIKISKIARSARKKDIMLFLEKFCNLFGFIVYPMIFLFFVYNFCLFLIFFRVGYVCLSIKNMLTVLSAAKPACKKGNN